MSDFCEKKTSDDEVGTGYLILNGHAFFGITEKNGETVVAMRTTMLRFNTLCDFIDKLADLAGDKISGPRDEMQISIDDDTRIEMVFWPDE